MHLNEAEARALTELFSVVDAVFTEPDAFDPKKRAIGYGRVFRAWRRARDVLAQQSYAPLRPRSPRSAAERESTHNQ